MGIKAAITAAGIATLISYSLPSVAQAASDTLAPITFATLQQKLTKLVNKLHLKDRVTARPCLDGEKEKRTICPFMLGDFMQVTAESKKGARDVVGLTFICVAKEPADTQKCFVASQFAMLEASPGVKLAVTDKIFGVLLDGIQLGSEVTLTTDERRFVLQKGAGLRLHIYAADAVD